MNFSIDLRVRQRILKDDQGHLREGLNFSYSVWELRDLNNRNKIGPADQYTEIVEQLHLIDEFIQRENQRLGFISKTTSLRSFSRRIDYWELLLRIMENRSSKDTGLNEIPSLCRYGGMHQHSLARFLREQIAAKLIYTEVGNRRDKKVLRPSEQLVSDLVDFSLLTNGLPRDFVRRP